MEEIKRKAIQQIVDVAIHNFALGISEKHIQEVNKIDGIINSKRNNIFIRELGDEFIFYSALVRSFDSSFGSVLQTMGNAIAKLNFETTEAIQSYLLPPQISKIQELKDAYSTDARHRIKPDVEHYNSFSCITPINTQSFEREHIADHCFYDSENDIYYIIELKAGGDLDNKKAAVEKEELLKEYFMLKNLKGANSNIKIYFATAYNKYGEGNHWNQGSVRNCFADEELLIGKDYWNFVCRDPQGFEIVLEQYKKSVAYIQEALEAVKEAYL